MNKSAENLIIVTCIDAIMVLFYMSFVGYEGIFNTIFLVIISNIILFFLIAKSNKSKFDFIIVLFFLRLFLLLIIFHFGWKNTLDLGNTVSGYDPERYYYQAIDLINDNFVLREGIINYAGIIYFYALLFKIFGANPITPIIVNNLFTAIIIYLSTQIIDWNDVVKVSSRRLKNIVILLAFLPELLWYDVLSSRESICMSLVFIAVYILIKISNERMTIQRLFWLGLIIIAVGLIRMSMIIPILCSALIISLLSNISRIDFKRVFLLLIIVVSLIALPSLARMLGSNKSDFLSLFDSLASTEILGDEGLSWSSNSIGKMLVADSPIKMLLLAPIRMGVYLITPLPTIPIDFEAMLMSVYSAWQNFFVVVSSIIYLRMIPLILAAIIAFVKKEYQNPVCKQIVAIFLVLLVTVACGNQIIHERYRIVVVPWIVLIYYVGKTADASTKKCAKVLFGLFFILAIVAYCVLKFM